MYCRNCGTQIADGSYFCNHCGADLAQDSNRNRNNNQNTNQEITESSLPEKYRPLGAWAYFGYTLLFAIPFIGLICLIVLSFNDTNINRRNFARSFWCILVIFVVAYFILIGAGVTFFSLAQKTRFR